MSTLQRHELISFGNFEVDLNSGEIRKAGMRVHLQGQPFRILAALLSRPGEVITREELQLQIWGEHTTIDFERGIATAMNKLREALGDSAEHPRYVETLAKRGFRFIAPIVIGPPYGAGPLAPPVSVAGPYSFESARLPDLLIAPEPVEPETSRSRADKPGLASGARIGRRWLPTTSTIAWLCFAALALMGTSAFVTWRAIRPTHVLQPSRVTQLTQSSEIYDGPPNPENLLTLVTDGPRIYTSFLVGGHPEIASLDLSGTQLQPVSMPDELSSVSIADISRDGSKLIVRGKHSRDSEQPLWMVPTQGSSALRIGNVLAHDATFMPGGRSILYAAGNDLGIAQLDTGALSKYASLPGRAFWLRWSPAENLLRFTLINPLNHLTSLWELDAATRGVHRLEFPELTGFSVCCGSWTADGSLYVFQATSARGSDIWTVSTGAHPQLTKLTNGPLNYISPMTSRTERTIFFVGRESPAGTRFYDQKLQQFVPAPSFMERARRVAYSRDRRWVAWVDVDGRLWRARSSDGTGHLQLTPDDLDVFMAQWSPDGSQLVLMAREPGKTWQIYSVDAAGGMLRLILADRRNLADPDWSADGRQIVFGREADLMGKEDGPRDIQILDLASHSAQKLPGSNNLFSPRWSPDGRWIVALSLDQTRLLLYDVRGRSWTTLFTGSAADPVWSLDSKCVYFHAFADPTSAILRVPVTGGAPQPVADLSKLGLPTVDDYFFGGVTPEGAPIIEPRIGTGNLFSVDLSR
jgi:Tol biopolymer transport system component/DNA-binding winged helix-turn-helix (wHTH) protein